MFCFVCVWLKHGEVYQFIMIHPSLCIYARIHKFIYIYIYAERVENAWLWVKYISTQWRPLCNEPLPRTQPISILSGWPSFFLVPQILQNMGHLGSRYIYIYIQTIYRYMFFVYINHGTKNTHTHTDRILSVGLSALNFGVFFAAIWKGETFRPLKHVFNTLRLNDGGGDLVSVDPKKKRTKTASFHEFTKWMTSWLCRIHSCKKYQKIAGKSPSSDWNIYIYIFKRPIFHQVMLA